MCKEITYPCEVVINKCFGGFGLSDEAMLWLHEHGMEEIRTPAKEYFGDDYKAEEAYKEFLEWKKNPDSHYFHTLFVDDGATVLSYYSTDNRGDFRTHPLLIQCVRELGHRANGWAAHLSIVTAFGPFTIEDYDGSETCEAVHEIYG